MRESHDGLKKKKEVNSMGKKKPELWIEVMTIRIQGHFWLMSFLLFSFL